MSPSRITPHSRNGGDAELLRSKTMEDSSICKWQICKFFHIISVLCAFAVVRRCPAQLAAERGHEGRLQIQTNYDFATQMIQVRIPRSLHTTVGSDPVRRGRGVRRLQLAPRRAQHLRLQGQIRLLLNSDQQSGHF